MNPVEHMYQDACEKLAVAVAQQTAEKLGVAITHDSEQKFDDFEQYCRSKKITASDRKKYDVYRRNVDLHIPGFVVDVSTRFSGERIQFTDIEKISRDENRKSDFLLEVGSRVKFGVSLKNYKGSIRRAQVCSGTFLSFANNFVFEPAGVGTYFDPTDPTQTKTFRGSDTESRSRALEAVHLGHLKQDFVACESINADVRKRLIDDPEFEFLDNEKEKMVDQIRKETGERGIEVALRILDEIPPDHIHRRILKMSGFDGAEEMLFFDPSERLDSLTHDGLRTFLRRLQSDDCKTRWRKNRQAIVFEVFSGSEPVFSVNVPFTINKNGAWISDPDFGHNKYHPKEKVHLSYGQRRPKKSRELATSTNTYLDLNKTSIFR